MALVKLSGFRPRLEMKVSNPPKGKTPSKSVKRKSAIYFFLNPWREMLVVVPWCHPKGGCCWEKTVFQRVRWKESPQRWMTGVFRWFEPISFRGASFVQMCKLGTTGSHTWTLGLDICWQQQEPGCHRELFTVSKDWHSSTKAEWMRERSLAVVYPSSLHFTHLIAGVAVQCQQQGFFFCSQQRTEGKTQKML